MSFRSFQRRQQRGRFVGQKKFCHIEDKDRDLSQVYGSPYGVFHEASRVSPVRIDRNWIERRPRHLIESKSWQPTSRSSM